MRITPIIDADHAYAHTKRAKLLDGPFLHAVNETLRRSLAHHAAEDRPVFCARPFRGGFRPGVDPPKTNQLNDEPETQAFVERDAG